MFWDTLDDIKSFFDDMTQGIFDTVFNIDGLYDLGILIWNTVIGLVASLAGTTPQNFSTLAWSYTTNTVMSFALVIGATLLNMMYMVGIIRHGMNLKDSFTAEIMIDALIKVMIGNFLMLNGIELIKILFKIAGLSAVGFLNAELSITPADMDIGASLFMFSFQMIFLIVSVVCSFQILLAVYGRYLDLYVLVGLGPFAWATIPGGSGISNTASAWVRTFLCKCFEIVVIAIYISIGSMLCKSINFGKATGALAEFDGAIQCLQTLATMVILTAAVKGAETTLRRGFNL